MILNGHFSDINFMPQMLMDIEVTPPDISIYKNGNTGIDYVHRFESGYPGPNITITALVHGNEICGAIALDYLFKMDIHPKIGSLTLCFCNTAAYFSFDQNYPYASRFIDEDFNRLWTREMLASSRNSQELSRAKEILPIIEQTDILLDLHSMSDNCPALALAGIQQKGVDFANSLGIPEYIIVDRGHSAGARLRDFAPFIEQGSQKNALLVECGQHWQKNSADVAIQTSLRFLSNQGLLNERETNTHINPNDMSPKQHILYVTDAITVIADKFNFIKHFAGLDEISKKGTLIGYDGDNPILTPYDNCVLIMPLASATKGQTAVRLARK